MKVWVTGATGLCGRAVIKVLAGSCELVASAYSRAQGDTYKVDLTSEDEVNSFFEEHQPEAVIHLAAERKPDVCENQRELTESLNVEATSRLAQLCAKSGAWFLYMSTDYVFDGQNPPYVPLDETNPLNFYGKTKLAGEKVVLANHSEACVLRVSVLYGYVEDLSESAITSIVKPYSQATEFKADHWAPRCPVFVEDVAQVITQMLKGKASGVYHYCGDEQMTKYETAVLMGQVLGLETDLVIPQETPTPGAPRPQDVRLDMTGLKAEGFYVESTPFKELIGDILRPHM